MKRRTIFSGNATVFYKLLSKMRAKWRKKRMRRLRRKRRQMKQRSK